MKPRRRKRVVRLLVATTVLAILYVGSYAVLAAGGDYFWSQSGKMRYAFGPAATDAEIWQPAHAWWEPFHDIYGNDTSRGNLLGLFYSPLIRLDRAWRHPTRDVFAEDRATPR